ncbi:hypothetical protein BX616_005005 [Lobosporangium transversale]|nr:hypothetical protein BX616_005005 [Lobosporangium transversale]
MGATCVISSILTLCSNVLYMLRGWEEPLPFYDWSSNAIRWMTSQLWYAIGMIFLLHVITRPAQSGVVLFGKFPRDLWAFKWQLCILYLPVRYMLLQLCDIHRDSKHILIPLEIVVDIVLYNGPFLIILLRLLYLAWKVAYDEAILTGAIYEDDSNASVCSLFDIRSYFLNSNGDHTRRGSATTIQGTNGYVGLAMMDLDEAEQGRSRVMVQERSGRNSMSQVNASSANKGKSEYAESLDSRSVGGQPSGSPPAYDSRDYLQAPKSFSPKMTGKAASKTCPRNSPRTSPKTSSPLRNVVFSLDSSDDEDSEEEHRRH